MMEAGPGGVEVRGSRVTEEKMCAPPHLSYALLLLSAVPPPLSYPTHLHEGGISRGQEAAQLVKHVGRQLIRAAVCHLEADAHLGGGGRTGGGKDERKEERGGRRGEEGGRGGGKKGDEGKGKCGQ